MRHVAPVVVRRILASLSLGLFLLACGGKVGAGGGTSTSPSESTQENPFDPTRCQLGLRRPVVCEDAKNTAGWQRLNGVEVQPLRCDVGPAEIACRCDAAGRGLCQLVTYDAGLTAAPTVHAALSLGACRASSYLTAEVDTWRALGIRRGGVYNCPVFDCEAITSPYQTPEIANEDACPFWQRAPGAAGYYPSCDARRKDANDKCSARCATSDDCEQSAECTHAGTCVYVCAASCGDYACGPGGACRTACTTRAECASGAACTQGVCQRAAP